MKEPNHSPIFKLSVRFLVICFTLLLVIFLIASFVNKPSINKSLNLGSLNYHNPPNKNPTPTEINNHLPEQVDNTPEEESPWDDVPTPPAKLKPRKRLNTDIKEINLTIKKINKGFENWKAVASWGQNQIIQQNQEVSQSASELKNSPSSEDSANVPPQDFNIFSRLKDKYSNFYNFFDPGIMMEKIKGFVILPPTKEDYEINGWTYKDLTQTVEETNTENTESINPIPSTQPPSLTHNELINKVTEMVEKIKRMMVTPTNADREKDIFTVQVKEVLAEMSKKDRKKFKSAMADILRELSPNHYPQTSTQDET